MNNNERIIVSNLLTNETFARKVLPFLREDFFQEQSSREIFKEVYAFFDEYKALPSLQAAVVQLTNKEKLTQDTVDNCIELIESSEQFTEGNQEWLIKLTEEFCQKRAIYNGIMESISIIDGKSKQTESAIPSILQDALAVSFDPHVGHDYFDDAESRYEYYTNKEAKIPFDLEILNRITNGGVQRKTLNLLLAGTNVGKTLIKCHLAAHYLMQGLNVLYITGEMAEQEIAKRIDVNLLDITMDEIEYMTKQEFLNKVKRNQSKTLGKLKIKEFPTSSAHAGHIRNVIEELRLKENFKADILIIDYLTIFASSRYKAGSVNSYTYYKAVAEEFRALAVEYNIPVWSSMQLNREGYNSSDADVDDTSESFGVPMTADFMAVVFTNEELDELCQIMWKQVKSRYRDKNRDKRFVTGIDRSRMRIYDVEDAAQAGILDGPDVSVFDKTGFGELDGERGKKASKFRGKSFRGGLKFD